MISYYERNKEKILARTRAYALAHPEQIRATGRRWRENNREKARAKNLAYKRSNRGRWKHFEQWIQRQYGIDVETYARAELAQDRKCAGCLESFDHTPGRRGVHVDHCHTTGRFRGLLCYSCNAALGLVRDRSDVLDRLKAYLASR